MINFDFTIDRKVAIKTASGEDIIDLAAPSLKKDVTFAVLDYVIVRDTEAMRPDYLTQRYYGDMSHTEMLLKFNGISNPFSIEEGDLIMIADPVAGRNAMNDNTVINRADVRKQYYQPEKEGKPDPKLKTFENRVTIKPASPKKNGQALPPNYANPGDKEVEIIGGKIVFGANISKGGTGVGDVPLEKLKFLANLKKSAAYKKVTKMNDAVPSSIANPSDAAAAKKEAELSPADKKKLADQKALREKEKLKLLDKVNLSKSELMSKLIKDLYGKV